MSLASGRDRGPGRSAESAEDSPESGAAATTRYADSGVSPASADESGAPEAPGDTGAPAEPDSPNAPDASSAAEPDAEADAPGTPDPAAPHDAAGASGSSAAAVTGAPPEADPAEAPAVPDAPGAPGALDPGAETSGDLDAPLLGDVTSLRDSWRRLQAGFVDDPREAVADAANLVEHTAQALAGALQQRQRLLRARWDHGRTPDAFLSPATGSPGGAASDGEGRLAPGDGPDTEELRRLIQRYRILFNHICRP